MAAFDGGVDAHFQFGGERLAEIEPHGVDLGSTGSAITAQASRRSLSARAAKVAMAAASADSGPGAAFACRLHGVKLAAGDGGDQFSAIKSVLDGK